MTPGQADPWASPVGGGIRATVVRVRDRAYADFAMPSRLGQYRAFLESALGAGYDIVSVDAFWRLVSGPGVDPARRHLVLRHDVDTDPGTAAAMWGIDRDLGVRSSYHFRLSTVDPVLMRAIADGGGDAGYHYEELATIGKRRALRTRADVDAYLPEVRAEFAGNLARLRTRTGLPMRVVSAHGDFVNRRLGVPNWELLVDAAFRAEAGVDADGYDRAILDRVTSQFSDVPHPRYWVPGDPIAAIHAGDPVLFVLVHPRHWRVDRIGNVRDDVRRLVEGVRYGLATRSRRRG